MDDSNDFNMACHQDWDPEQFLPLALPNDRDLLTEIQCFSGNEAIFDELTYTISRLALEVVCWLQVCPLCHSGRPFSIFPIPIIYQRCDDPPEETVSLWKSYILEVHLG